VTAYKCAGLIPHTELMESGYIKNAEDWIDILKFTGKMNIEH
jgi:hypothetical protein